MSNITATINVEKKSWSLEKNFNNNRLPEKGEGQDSFEIRIAAAPDGLDSIEYTVLGYKLLKGDIEIRTVRFPEFGHIETLQPVVIIADSIIIEDAVEYTFEVWMQNGTERFEKTFTFTSPRPPKPYESWSWNGTEWTAPIPEPTNKKGAAFAWSERMQKWVELIPPLTDYDDI